eukprot:1192441-Prorocentrum_minimum.AAC.2
MASVKNRWENSSENRILSRVTRWLNKVLTVNSLGPWTSSSGAASCLIGAGRGGGQSSPVEVVCSIRDLSDTQFTRGMCDP